MAVVVVVVVVVVVMVVMVVVVVMMVMMVVGFGVPMSVSTGERLPNGKVVDTGVIGGIGKRG